MSQAKPISGNKNAKRIASAAMCAMVTSLDVTAAGERERAVVVFISLGFE
jgi:hypothetical protein